MNVLGWFTHLCYTFACCMCYLFVRDLDGEDHYYTVHLSLSLLFPVLLVWWWFYLHWIPTSDRLTLFDDVKRGKMSMTSFQLVCLVLSWPLNSCFLSCVDWINYFGTNVFCLAIDVDKWSFGLSSSKREKLLTQLMCKVLMITIQMY